jgi:exopolysaccharide/PEP-CTERM locus tyrosine autokinase
MSRIEKAIEKANKLREEGSRAEAAKTAPAAAPDTFKPEASAKADNPYLVAITEPESPATEEYRKLKSMVVKLTRSGNLHNTIMVTSAVGGEGKSLTALNLAITLAQEYDHTVLLVDADLRQPSVHEYLGIEPKTGLSDCLTNGKDISLALIKTGIGRLTLLPSGSRVSDPVELLLSRKMRDLVKEMKHRYVDRYIIFDTPPVLPFAEAHSIGSVVDGVIFVVREGHAPMNSIKEAVGILKGANILGVVYNDADVTRFDSAYHYHYRSYYLSKGKVEDGSNGLSGWRHSLKILSRNKGKT